MNGSGVTDRVLQILERHIDGTPPWRGDVGTRKAAEVRIDELGVTSAEMINVVIDIEDAFGLEVRDEHIYTLRTVGDVLRAVELGLERVRAAS